MKHSAPTLVIFGAALGTGNLGVDALAYSIVDGLSRRSQETTLALADFKPGVRTTPLALFHSAVTVRRFGVLPTRRVHLPESLTRIRFELRTGLRKSASAEVIRGAAAVLDISGGDSFTDLYGKDRFTAIVAPKRIAVDTGKPLILLPQTYGPFNDPDRRKLASKLVQRAHRCWARDARSYAILRDLLGDAYDPSRHFAGVDVAFLLPRARSDRTASQAGEPFAGVNVSGLIWNDPESARDRYRFKADYRRVMLSLVERLAAESLVQLIPHVVTPPGHYESDRAACESLVSMLPESARHAVKVVPEPENPCEAKEIISQSHWFCGTRMHATIAALSSGVPTAAVAYSDKTRGVFETCGQGDEVIDPRVMGTEEVIERLWHSYQRRDAVRASLARALPGVLARASEQMDEVAQVVRSASAARSVGAAAS